MARERWTVRWFRRRALLYHLLVSVIVPLCLWAAWWQVHRAADGNTLSYLYAVEWPVFAVLAVVGWWQLIHEDPADVDSRKIERARRAATTGPFVPPSPDAPSGFAHPLQPGALAALERPGRDRILDAGGAARVPAVRRSAAVAEADDGTGERWPAGDETAGDETADGTPVHTLSAYNAYLARLAAGNTRKSWRNPHGHPGRR